MHSVYRKVISEGVPAGDEAELLAQPRPGRPTQGEAHGQEAGRQSQRPPRPGRHQPRQSLREDAARAVRIAAEQFADAEPPGDAVATPREIGQRPSVAAVDMPSRGIAPGATGFRLRGRDQESDLGLGFITAPGLELQR